MQRLRPLMLLAALWAPTVYAQKRPKHVFAVIIDDLGYDDLCGWVTHGLFGRCTPTVCGSTAGTFCEPIKRVPGNPCIGIAVALRASDPSRGSCTTQFLLQVLLQTGLKVIVRR
eukprot:gene12606-biopygen7899